MTWIGPCSLCMQSHRLLEASNNLELNQEYFLSIFHCDRVNIRLDFLWTSISIFGKLTQLINCCQCRVICMRFWEKKCPGMVAMKYLCTKQINRLKASCEEGGFAQCKCKERIHAPWICCSDFSNCPGPSPHRIYRNRISVGSSRALPADFRGKCRSF